MNILLFPGQGSQFTGMGRDLYENHAVARDIFDRIDSALNQKLSDLMFNGPESELNLTENVQPAIFAVSAAMLAVCNPKFDFVAGHSLGEYGALYAAGVIELEDTARLLKLRGRAMQDAVPIGVGLVAVIIGLEIDTLREICKSAKCEIANDNGAGQFVISGYRDAVELAMEMAKSAGARRAMPLNLSTPVHCSLQEKTAETMRTAMDGTEFKNPTVPFLSNKTAELMTDVNEIRESLAYQITHGVRWRESVLNMKNFGITGFMECGPGNVLSGLISRIDKDLQKEELCLI